MYITCTYYYVVPIVFDYYPEKIKKITELVFYNTSVIRFSRMICKELYFLYILSGSLARLLMGRRITCVFN